MTRDEILRHLAECVLRECEETDTLADGDACVARAALDLLGDEIPECWREPPPRPPPWEPSGPEAAVVTVGGRRVKGVTMVNWSTDRVSDLGTMSVQVEPDSPSHAWLRAAREAQSLGVSSSALALHVVDALDGRTLLASARVLIIGGPSRPETGRPWHFACVGCGGAPGFTRLRCKVAP